MTKIKNSEKENVRIIYWEMQQNKQQLRRFYW